MIYVGFVARAEKSRQSEGSKINNEDQKVNESVQ